VRILSGDEALKELANTGVLTDAQVHGSISLTSIAADEMYEAPITIARCDIDALDACCVQFTKPVMLEDCLIDIGEFFAAYFLAGLTVRACRFKSRAWFQSGGHNRNATVVRFMDTTFESFANFLDGWYEGPFELRRCTFRKGTNLLGNIGQPFQVRFDLSPVLEDNVGDLNVDGGFEVEN
jgi:hypothetical protein